MNIKAILKSALLPLIFFMSTIFCVSLQAAIHLELTQGISAAIPIAIIPFVNQYDAKQNANNKDFDAITKIVVNDLQTSGRFNVLSLEKIKQFPRQIQQVNLKYWQQTGVNDIVIGQLKSVGSNRYQLNFSLLSVYEGQQNTPFARANSVLVSEQFIINKRDFRRIAHQISDIIYQQLTGVKGIFSTRIAYVLVERKPNSPTKYLLNIADADGFNSQPILISNAPIMSPAWSPNGKEIAYVSFENKRSAIYIADIATGKRTRLISDNGINGAPAWSPDGTTLALVLSKTGHPKIYSMDLKSHQLQQLTHGSSIDTEPSWAPDGKSLIFTSNRGGTPQIYSLTFATSKVERITYDGKYNATASFTPSADDIILLHQGQKHFNIAVQDLASGALTELTRTGYESSPSIAPNGKMIIYANNKGIQGTLGIISIDGKIKLKLPAPEGSIQEPAWGPF